MVPVARFYCLLQNLSRVCMFVFLSVLVLSFNRTTCTNFRVPSEHVEKPLYWPKPRFFFPETVSFIRGYILADPDLHKNKSRVVEGWGWDHASWDEVKWPNWVCTYLFLLKFGLNARFYFYYRRTLRPIRSSLAVLSFCKAGMDMHSGYLELFWMALSLYQRLTLEDSSFVIKWTESQPVRVSCHHVMVFLFVPLTRYVLPRCIDGQRSRAYPTLWTDGKRFRKTIQDYGARSDRSGAYISTRCRIQPCLFSIF